MGQAQSAVLRRGIAPALVLTIGLLLSAGAALGVAMMSSARDIARFEHATDGAKDRITARLEAYITLLRSGSAFISVSEEVTFDEFEGFVDRFRLSEFYPGIQGVGYSARVRPNSQDSLLTSLRAGPFPDFEIWPETPAREELHSIVYLVPLDARNRAAIGYDMFSESTRRAAMSAARDSGRVFMSGRVTLVQEIAGPTQAGFLLYAPVYASGGVPPTVGQRREDLAGFFYAPFRADDLFDGIFGSEELPLVAFRVYDGPESDAANLLHDSSEQGIVRARNTKFQSVERLAIAGRPWTIEFASTAAFEADSRHHNWMLMLMLGLAASAGLYLVATREANARDAAEVLAGQLQSTTVQLEAQITEVRGLNAEIERANAELTDAVEALRLSNNELELLRDEADAARDEAFRANQAKSEFLAAMSHELRTPLNAILGYTELMEMGIDGPITDRQRQALGRIKRSQTHLLGLINDLLSYAKIDAGAVEVRNDVIPVHRLLEDLEAMTSPQIRERGHALTVAQDTRVVAVLGDEEKIQQILINLLSNAIKFTEPGGTIEISATEENEMVSIRIADSGRGIPPDRLSTIFEPFVQLDRFSVKDGQQGVGLGLAISRDLVELLGGELTVVSEVGKGSAFTVRLRRAFLGYVEDEDELGRRRVGRRSS